MEQNLRLTSLSDIGLKKFAPAIVFFIVVIILVCLPGEALPKEHDWMSIAYVDKWVHTAMFGIMTFLFLLPVGHSTLYRQQRRHYFIRIGLSAVIWGLTTEYIQGFYIPTRSFDLYDWAADSLGVLIAFIYCRRFHQR